MLNVEFKRAENAIDLMNDVQLQITEHNDKLDFLIAKMENMSAVEFIIWLRSYKKERK